METSSLKLFFTGLAMRTIGTWSDGIRLAMKEGFTSGIMLDYVYKNRPGGKFFIGKMIDGMFLEHEGCRVIRERKNNLCVNLENAIELTLHLKNHAHLCDVAAGPALYITDVLEKYKDENVSAEIRDIDARWLEEAKKRADAKGLNLTYKVADALEKSDFVFDTPPDIFVASGFYDWFNDAEMIKKSMRLIYESLPENGYFVFTNQTGHVALDLTNHIFRDFNNKPLKMVTWDADVVRSWVEESGFEIVDVKKDEKCYYLNILAVKIR